MSPSRPIGPRFAGMPRARPAPEHNLIQNPHLTRSLQRVTGLRQAHIQPALADGIQPTISVGDVRDDPRTAWPKSYAAFIEQAAPASDVTRAVFVNPTGNDTICVLRRLHVFLPPTYISAGSYYDLIYSYAPQTGIVLNPVITTRGKRMVSGFEWSPVGVAAQPPPENYDIEFPTPAFSKCGWHSPMIVPGIDGSYYWRGTFAYQYLEDFGNGTGPRYFVYPGGTWHGYVLSSDVGVYWNMWWDEYPLR